MRRERRIAMLAISWLLLAATLPARAQLASTEPGSALPPVIDCRTASEMAEQAEGLPAGLLLAIGKIETGRPNPATGKIEPYPWATNQGGVGHYFGSAQDAIAWTAAAQSRGFASIDVGCFQINLMYHPEAFTTLENAFDPVANARYAARFLAGLYRRAGGWPLAVAQYHSADPALGMPYGDKVYSAWNGTWPGGNDQIGRGTGTTVALRPPGAADPFALRLSDQAFGIRVIVPSWAMSTPPSGPQPAPTLLHDVALHPLQGASRGMPMVTTAASGGAMPPGSGWVHAGSRLPQVFRP